MRHYLFLFYCSFFVLLLVIRMFLNYIVSYSYGHQHLDVKKVSFFLFRLVLVDHLVDQDGAEHGSRVAISGKTLQFFVCFICYFVVLHVGRC